jgi:hypothetical protein
VVQLCHLYTGGKHVHVLSLITQNSCFGANASLCPAQVYLSQPSRGLGRAWRTHFMPQKGHECLCTKRYSHKANKTQGVQALPHVNFLRLHSIFTAVNNSMATSEAAKLQGPTQDQHARILSSAFCYTLTQLLARVVSFISQLTQLSGKSSCISQTCKLTTC